MQSNNDTPSLPPPSESEPQSDQSVHDIQTINNFLNLIQRGMHPIFHNTELVFDALTSLGGVSEDNDGCILLLSSSNEISFLSFILTVLIWSINGGGQMNIAHSQLPKRRLRAYNKDASKNKFYNDRITTVVLRLMYNVIQHHLNVKMNKDGVHGVKRIVLSEGVDQSIEDISSYLMLQLLPSHSLSADGKKTNFNLALHILSRTCELECVRNLWYPSSTKKDDEENILSRSRNELFSKFKNNNDKIEDDEEIFNGMQVLINILESDFNLTPSNYCCAFRIVNFITKWNMNAKEKAIPCISASIEILELFHHNEKVILQCFGMLASMSYNCVSVQEEMLESGVAPLAVNSFIKYHETNPKIVIQCLGFVSSFVARGGPRAGLAIVPCMVDKKFMTAILETVQMYPRRDQIQRLATNVLALAVALVLSNIKENDVDSELSEEESQDEEDDGKRKMKPPSLKEILYDLYDELQILSVCSGIERRLKLVEESYERKNDDSKKKYFMKTYQSLALIKKFYERETWKRENPDSDGEY